MWLKYANSMPFCFLCNITYWIKWIVILRLKITKMFSLPWELLMFMCVASDNTTTGCSSVPRFWGADPKRPRRVTELIANTNKKAINISVQLDTNEFTLTFLSGNSGRCRLMSWFFSFKESLSGIFHFLWYGSYRTKTRLVVNLTNSTHRALNKF